MKKRIQNAIWLAIATMVCLGLAATPAYLSLAGGTLRGALFLGTTGLVDSGNYSSFATACTDAVSKNATLFVSKSWTSLSTQTCAANLSFPVGTGGSALLQPASGQTLTLTGSIVAAPLSQIFDPSAGGSFSLTRVPIVYPEWFGAAGNGTAADGPAVQAAINSTTIRVALTGTYKIAAQLYVLEAQSGLTITGPGKLTHGTTLTPYSPLIGMAPNSSIVVYTATNVTIRDLTIDQTGLTTAQCDGIVYFFESDDGVVENDTIINTTGNGIHFYETNDDAIIAHNTVIAPIFDGIDFHSSSRRARISDNLVEDVGGVGSTSSAGVAYEVEGRIGGTDTNIQPVYDVTFSNNQARNQTQTTSQAYLIDWSQNVTITGGTVNNLGGVDLLFDQGVTVSGVTFLNCPWAVAVSTQGYTHNWTGAAVGSSSQDVMAVGNTWVYTAATYPASPRYPGVYTNDSGLDVRVIGNPVADLAVFPASAVYYARLTTLGQPTGLTIASNTLTGGFTNFITNANNLRADNNDIGLAFGGALMTFPSGNLSGVLFRGNTVDNMNTLQIANASGTITNFDFSNDVFKALNQSEGIVTPSSATLVGTRICGDVFWDTAKIPIALGGAAAASDSIVCNNVAVGSALGSSAVTATGNSFAAPSTAAPVALPNGSSFFVLEAAGTQTVSGCSLTSASGGASGGSFHSGTAGTCTVTITPGITAPHGYACTATDLTTAADTVKQTATATTSCTISGTTASADVITWQASAF